MSFKAHYANADVAAAFASLGLARGDVVYLSGNLGNLGFHASGNKTATLEGFLAALFEVIGPEGTVVVPTHRPMVRLDLQDQIFQSVEEKYEAILRDIQERHQRGQQRIGAG